MRKMKERTVVALLNENIKGFRRRFKYRKQRKSVYIYCRSKSIAYRFLSDAEQEGFLFADGKRPTQKDHWDIYALNEDLTISYTGWAGHVIFKNALAGNVVRIDYGRYITGVKNYLIV